MRKYTFALVIWILIFFLCPVLAAQQKVKKNPGTTGLQADAEPTTGWELTWENSQAGSITCDNAGNVIVTGCFMGTTDFDPSPEVLIEYTPADPPEAYVSKFTGDGDFLWSRVWNGTPSEVAVDGIGNVYVTGSFTGTVNFDPTTELHYRTSNGGEDAFLIKFDSRGVFQWVRAWGGAMDDTGTNASVDGTGNIFVSGNFQDAVDFNPVGEPAPAESVGYSDVFLAKYAADGTFHWVSTRGGITSDICTGLVLDGIGNAYMAGWYWVGTEPEILSGANKDAYLCKVSSAGVPEWEVSWGGSYEDNAMTLSTSPDGHLYVAGGFRGTNIDFDPGPLVSPISSSDVSVYVSKFDLNGIFKWVRTWNGIVFDACVYANREVIIIGKYSGAKDFDPGPPKCELRGSGAYANIIDLYGKHEWAEKYDALCLSVCVDQVGNIYLAGQKNQMAWVKKILPDERL